jgi:hypothetical protein
MQAVTVKILRPVSAGSSGSFAPGQVVQLPADLAASLVSVRKAVPFAEPASAPVEVAAVSPVVETADAAPTPATIRRKAAKK